VAGPCEHGNELSASLLRENSAPWGKLEERCDLKSALLPGKGFGGDISRFLALFYELRAVHHNFGNWPVQP
jgi:hypothetical protein